MYRLRAHIALLATSVLVLSTIPLGAVGAAEPKATGGDEEHCVVTVLDQDATGELRLSEPVCFDTFAESMSFASEGTLQLDADTSGSALFSDESIAAAASTFTLGVHYDGYNGSGASISVVGSSCTGGYWNTSSSWDNRISSSWNGCYHLKHWDYPNMSGTSMHTYGVGQIDNLTSFNNRTESVSYHSS